MSERPRAGRVPPHGSMADEAAKLVDVAHLWLAAQSAGRGTSDDVWSAATAGPTEPAECRGCPICRVRRAVGEVDPAVYGHLADAVSALGAALRAFDSGRRGGRRP